MNRKFGCGEIGVLIVILIGLLVFGMNQVYNGLIEDKVNTILFGIALALIPFLSLFGYLVSKIGGKFRWSGGTKWILTLTLSAVGISAATFGVWNLVNSVRPDNEVLQAFKDVCSGKGVAEAAGYHSGQVWPYHMILLKSSGDPDVWGREIDESWKPDSIQDVNLVVCMEDLKHNYDNGCGYQRSGSERDLRLIDAKTGEVIGSKMLTCSPPACVLVKSAATSTSCTLRSGQVEDWVERSIGISDWWAELYSPGSTSHNTGTRNWGNLNFKVSPDHSYIKVEFVHFAMEDVACGSADLPLPISFLDEPMGTISESYFEVQLRVKRPGILKLSGSLDFQVPYASGTWELFDKDGNSLCSSLWESN